MRIWWYLGDKQFSMIIISKDLLFARIVPCNASSILDVAICDCCYLWLLLFVTFGQIWRCYLWLLLFVTFGMTWDRNFDLVYILCKFCVWLLRFLILVMCNCKTWSIDSLHIKAEIRRKKLLTVFAIFTSCLSFTGL